MDEMGNVDNRVPEWTEVLPTGLRMILDDGFVTHVWQSERQRETLNDLLVSLTSNFR